MLFFLQNRHKIHCSWIVLWTNVEGKKDRRKVDEEFKKFLCWRFTVFDHMNLVISSPVCQWGDLDWGWLCGPSSLAAAPCCLFVSRSVLLMLALHYRHCWLNCCGRWQVTTIELHHGGSALNWDSYLCPFSSRLIWWTESLRPNKLM